MNPAQIFLVSLATIVIWYFGFMARDTDGEDSSIEKFFATGAFVLLGGSAVAAVTSLVKILIASL